jgi:DNA-binding PadR family transcriptional regulator
MKSKKIYLGEFEEIVLLATLTLGEKAYGTTIRKAVEETAGRFISVGALYATLDRLEQKGFVSSRQGEATNERGGRAKRYFKVEACGLKALREAQSVRRKFFAELTPDILGSAI